MIPLDYIESTGTQYIDTGIVGTENTKVEIKLKTDRTGTWPVILGATSGDLGGDAIVLRQYSSEANYTCNFGTNYSSAPRSTGLSVGTDHTIIAYKNYLSVDGTVYTSTTQSLTTTPTRHMYLFAGNNNNSVWRQWSGCIYYCKIYDGSTLVRDFIPVVDENSVACMYDNISREYFYNRGTGNFIAPIPPSTDTEYRYVKMDITARRGGGSGYIQLSEFMLLDANNNRYPYTSTTTITSTTNPTSTNENASKLLDNNTGTKFCTNTQGTTSFTIDLGVGNYVDIDVYSKYCWYTANDGTDRDPVSWVISVSNDNSTWEILDTVVSATITTSRRALAYTGSLVATYLIQFNDGGNNYTQTVVVGEPTDLIPNTFTKTNYSFMGWDTSSSAETVVYTDEEEVTDLTTAGNTFNLYAVWEKAFAYLIKSGNNYYKYENSTRTQVSISTLNAEAFRNYGGQETIPSSALIDLTSPTVYLWNSTHQPTISADVSAVPFTIIGTTNKDFSDSTIEGLEALSAVYSGDVSVEYSGDNSTWYGMYQMADFLAIDPAVIYNRLSNDKILYLKIHIANATSVLTSITFECDNGDD